MFSCEGVIVDLRCDNNLMKTMVGCFGWVFGFGGKVQILAPESVKQQYKQMVINAMAISEKEQRCYGE